MKIKQGILDKYVTKIHFEGSAISFFLHKFELVLKSLFPIT